MVIRILFVAAFVIAPVVALAQQGAPATDSGAVIVGNPKGDVTLVEFFDFNCMPCRAAHVKVKELLASDPGVKLVLRHRPLFPGGSVEAARVALAVKTHLPVPMYLEFHSKLMSTQGRVGKERALEVAGEMGLDKRQIEKEARSRAITAGLEQTDVIAGGLMSRGVPDIRYNGKRLLTSNLQFEVERARRCEAEGVDSVACR